MKFKLDENLGYLGKSVLEAEGHDVQTVAEQRLSGASDGEVYTVARREGRALVTLDRDFGEVLRFPPEATAGIVVIASPGILSKATIRARMNDLAALLRVEKLEGALWIIEAARVRIHQRRGPTDETESQA